ncbi:PTTG1 interacting protein b [Nerophis lumbriciformis]|uniref:PTTG1 interacting protein b n=1 Tax=Nerophis lumbriciformis TaxID=546530 RepID=UPI002AE0785F|nr:pituitary tumor-transforming gene 1 protein-interacting protein-like [Nerophis lumbriciformis]
MIILFRLCSTSTMFAFLGVFLFFSLRLVVTEAQTSTPSAAPIASCAAKSNTSCEECLQNVNCLWCLPTKQCVVYPVKSVLPPSSVCPLKEARWGLCWVNFQILIITLSVIAGVLLIALLACCMCCCCRRQRTRNDDYDDDIREAQQNHARNSRQKERRMEMQLRHDKIRQKYGLAKDNPYSRIDDKK